MDWWKVVIIVLLVAIVLGLLALLSSLDYGQTSGTQALSQLETPGEDGYSVAIKWSPVDIGRSVVATMFDLTSATGVNYNLWSTMKVAFASAFVVVGVAIVIKIILKIAGGG